MTEEMIVRHCAPTLARLKTGNMFACPFESETEMNLSIRAFNRRMRKKGLRMLPLRFREGKGLVYLYRPCRLEKDLAHRCAHCLLQESGYACPGAGACIRTLREKLKNSPDFPHEIGLFLGYPPEDVYGFIHHKEKARCCGCWKVYQDEENALRTFARFKKCSRIYMELFRNGRSMDRLSVAG